jgi:ERCC4-related helicase
MFTFGAIRGYRSELSESSLVSDRLFHCILNGCYYLHPFFSPIKLKHFMDRIQVHLENKNADDYAIIYCELRGTNKNIFL